MPVSRRSMLILGAAGAPCALLRIPPAQSRPTLARVGFMSSVLDAREPFWAPFFTELQKRGWREGEGYSLEARKYGGDPQRALALAKELVALRVDVLVASSGGAAGAARAATTTVPVVALLGYPVEAGLAESLAHPGGNVTGVAVYGSAEVWGKFIELLRELKPGMRELGVLWDYAPPGFPDGHVPLPIIERVAKQLGIATRVWINRSARDAEASLAAIERSAVDALIVSHGGGIHIPFAARIAQVLAHRRLPAITDVIHPAVLEKAGCVLAYSPNVPEMLGRLAHLVDRVLRGASPAGLPFELPSRFDFAVNAKAAKAIGIEVPPTMLARADRVIE